MKYWLVKSDAECYSIDDFMSESARRKGGVPWTGVRNYQARNYMRDSMGVGDRVLFYHSGKVPAVAGIAEVTTLVHPDLTAQDSTDEHYDPKATKTNPIWYCVDLKFVKKFKNPVTLAQIKFDSDLRDMVVAQTGSRLSVQQVSEKHFKGVVMLGK